MLKAQGSISYVQTDKETYDMEQHWIDRLAAQYGARQAAALRGDSVGTKAAEFLLGQIASEHWHEIIAALRGAETPNVEVTGAARLYRAASVWTAGFGRI